MNSKIKKVSVYLALFIMLLSWVSLPIKAKEKQVKSNIANTWLFVPKAGQSNKFEKAFKKHIAFRKSKKDPRTWQVYQAEMGANMDTYYVRYCCVSWPDIDEYTTWATKAKVSKNWLKNVSKFVAHYELNRSETDFKNSNWSKDLKYKYVGVTNYKVKMGHYEEVTKDREIFSKAAKKENWPYNWSWSDNINGTGGMSLAIPYMNYSAMTPPETKFSEMLAKYLGSEDKAKKVLDRWRTHFESISYNIYVLRDDLSM